VTVAQGASTFNFIVDGIGVGSTSFTAGATGWTSSPAMAVSVENPRLTINSIPATVTTATASTSFYVRVVTSCGACDDLNTDQTVTFTVAGAPSGILATPASIVILAAGPNYTWTTFGKPTTTGSFTITATAAGLPGAPSITSSTVTVPS
jgi:hypothetical protein